MRLTATLLLFLVSLTLCATPIRAEEPSWTSFRFTAYDREYVDVRSGAEWEQDGAIAVRVRSPAHRLVVRDHTVRLKPLGGGTFDSRVRVSFSGEGDLVAELGAAGAETQLEDHVVVPLQEVQVAARVRFVRVEGGYELEPLELPEAVEVEIDSRLGNQVIEVCRSTLALLGISCKGLDSMFSVARVPLPEPGGIYFVAESQLEAAERRRLDRFLERHR